MLAAAAAARPAETPGLRLARARAGSAGVCFEISSSIFGRGPNRDPAAAALP